MSLTPSQSTAIDDLTLQLVDWLPGSSPWGAKFRERRAPDTLADSF